MLSSPSFMRAAQVAARIGEIQLIASTNSLDEISRALWEDLGADRLSSDEAEQISEAIDGSRRVLKALQATSAERRLADAVRRNFLPRKRRQIAPDRAEKIARRRRVVLLGWLPANIGAGFTYGEVAALSVVAEIVAASGVCKASVQEIAARSGTSVSTVQSAMRTAHRAGLINKRERRVPGRKSLTNVITIISHDWTAWLDRRGKGKAQRERQNATTGFKMPNPMNQLAFREGKAGKFGSNGQGFSRLTGASGFSTKIGRS